MKTKIRFWDRLILFLGALLTVAAGVFLAVLGLQFLGALGESLSLGIRIGCIAGGALLVAFGVYLFVFPARRAGSKHEFIVQQTDNGELRIAVTAVENLVQKCVDMHEEIDLNSMHIRNAREGVTVDLRISLPNNISIPLAVASLQKQIKQYLVASSGIEVREVRVSVETAGGGAEDSPYLVPSSGQAEKKADKPEKTAEKPASADNGRSKLPLHQRIFGRPEQAAVVPEPPKEAPQEEASQQPADEEAEEAVTAPETPEPEAPEAEAAAVEAPAEEPETGVPETAEPAFEPAEAPAEEPAESGDADKAAEDEERKKENQA